MLSIEAAAQSVKQVILGAEANYLVALKSYGSATAASAGASARRGGAS